MSKILSSEIWPTIFKLTKNSKKKSYIAVGYLGTNARNLLSLKENDFLVVDCSISSLKQGHTNPDEIMYFLKKGVQIHSYEGLHSKIYVINNSVIVGSNNISKNSKNYLKEASVILNDPELRKDAIKFVKSVAGNQLTPEYVKSIKKFYKPPKFSISGERRNIPSEKLFLESTWDNTVWDEKDQEIFEANEKLLASKVRDNKKYTVGTISEGSLNIRYNPGDLMIEIYYLNNKKYVYPPTRILKTVKYQNNNKKNTQVFYESLKNPKHKPWSEFKKLLNKIGVSTKRKIILREIRNPDKRQAILNFWL